MPLILLLYEIMKQVFVEYLYSHLCFLVFIDWSWTILCMKSSMIIEDDLLNA